MAGFRAAAAAAKLLQSCPTLCDPIDGRAEFFVFCFFLLGRWQISW